MKIQSELYSNIKNLGIKSPKDNKMASSMLLQAVMELINTGSYISWKLPKYTNIVLEKKNQCEFNLYFTNKFDIIVV